ncbi:MAG: SGNH/GDSL hydrolase family protein [Gloeocapsa sp. DLM2.Bin57]|nr:MAG: SGNH/GDSL hydrolase family protein [Gloeocapsa sp. DLM2.Bin57]
MKLIWLVLLLILGLELGLRLFVGLGNPLLYIADQEIGYLLAPNQRVRRRGNLIVINNSSQRNENISQQLPELRILLLGDSIANGGWWTSQDRTISALLTAKLEQELGVTVEVLNASANSWGPRNQLAYLQKYGTFDSQIVILLLNTDDFFAIAPNSFLVGNSKHYPSKKPLLGMGELLNNFIREATLPEMVTANQEKGDRVGFNLTAIAQIHQLSQQNQAQLIIGLTPLQRESLSQSKEHEIKARQRLDSLVSSLEIPYLDFLPLFQQVNSPDSLYWDHIHLNSRGNQLVVDNLTIKVVGRIKN